MDAYRAPWALVLAAGEGNRLRSLTTDPLRQLDSQTVLLAQRRRVVAAARASACDPGCAVVEDHDHRRGAARGVVARRARLHASIERGRAAVQPRHRGRCVAAAASNCRPGIPKRASCSCRVGSLRRRRAACWNGRCTWRWPRSIVDRTAWCCWASCPTNRIPSFGWIVPAAHGRARRP